MTNLEVIIAISIYTHIYYTHKGKKPSDNPSPEDYFNTFDFREIESDSRKQAALT